MEQAIARLRAATREVHQQIEQLGYAQALLAGTLPLALYGSFLRALHTIEVALEQAIERSGSGALRTTFGRTVERRLRLERDLAYLGVDPHGVDRAALSALVLGQRMRLAAERAPHALLGYLYVVEGSQLGGLVQRAALAQRSELQQGGLTYLSGDGKNTQRRFEEFSARLESAAGDEATIELAVRGALEAFAGFAAVLAALDPSGHSDEPRSLVGELNGEAGAHPMPEDLREIQAALRAGERSWRSFAYYEARYGERGLRFTRSDSAWLATLAREDASLSLRHIRWLGRVLAARGMPRLLLEQHLALLHEELATSVAERATHYGALLLCAEELRQERTRALPAEREHVLVEAFCRGTQMEHGITPREAASLLTSALADQLNDTPNALSSLASWLADPARFSQHWREAVQQTLTLARDHR